MLANYNRLWTIAILSTVVSLTHAAERMDDSDLGNNYLTQQGGKKLPFAALDQQKADDNQELQLEITKAAEPPQTPFLTKINMEATGLRLHLEPNAFSQYFGEYASYDIGQERYSYRWAGHYNQIFDLSEYQRYIYSGNGTFEMDGNISGTVFVTTTAHDNEYYTNTFRGNYVF